MHLIMTCKKVLLKYIMRHDMNWLSLDYANNCIYQLTCTKLLMASHLLDKFSYISGGSRDIESCNLYTYKSAKTFPTCIKVNY